jgi:DNA-binding PadR family transcriptional regulator
LLEDKPRHFYELMRGGTAKSLYPTLQRLCDEGLVNVDAAFGWRTYWLSAAGKAELRKTNATNTYAFFAEQAWPERA